MNLHSLPTPSLVLDLERLQRNAARMSLRVQELGATLRPHVKTHKCIEVARIQTAGHSGAITVSTLAEAQAFAANGFTDITYAVPIEPGKFAAAIEVGKLCKHFYLLTDDLETPNLLNQAAVSAGVSLNLFLKVDCGYHRCGVEPQSSAALEIPQRISQSSNLTFAGILTHAGHSYHCRDKGERLAVARQERDIMVELALRLRTEGIDVPKVSIGSTPTITTVDHLDGVDEVRPGNYAFFDGFQATIGTCSLDDCALTVLAAVVHQNTRRGKVVIDAGALALSKDHGAVEFDPISGYGRLLDLQGNDLGLQVDSLSQEHGEVLARADHTVAGLKVGSRVRVLANHSCLTAAQHSHYNVIEKEEIVAQWRIERGW